MTYTTYGDPPGTVAPHATAMHLFQGQAQAQQNVYAVAAEETALSAINERLDARNKMLDILLSRIGAALNRAQGCQPPEPIQGQSVQAVPDGALDEINLKVGYFGDMLDQLDRLTIRIERIA